MLVAAGPFLHIPSFTDSDELRKPRRFLGAAGLVLELHDLADKRRLLRPQRHTADPTEHVVVSNPELHARAHHSHHEPAKLATTDLDFLATRPLLPPERIALGRVQIAQPLIRFEHNGFVILESLDLEKPALAFRGTPAFVLQIRRADHHGFVAFAKTLIVEKVRARRSCADLPARNLFRDTHARAVSSIRRVRPPDSCSISRPCKPPWFDQRPESGKPVEIRREDDSILVLDLD